METRLANTWRQTVNEKKFIETALASDLRIDGRNPLEFRKLSIKLGKEEGCSDVQLGQTHVMASVSAQLVEPYRDRPNEGSLAIFTEFSPMADPSFEPGRQGESAVELGRVIDRGLRESRAVDTESLCVLAGKLVWAIRIDLHILDNGGNLVDAANVAALAALLTFRRPECSVGGEGGQEVTVHPLEAREPLPLIVHHLPISVTFAFFGSDGKMVVDPTHQEEAVMGGRMTVTVNANGDICAIQKAGGEGVQQSDIMRCLRLASRNAESITKKIRDAVEAYNTERALRKIKRRPATVATNVDLVGSDLKDEDNKPEVTEFSRHHIERLKLESEEHKSDELGRDDKLSTQGRSGQEVGKSKNFLGGPSSWDPYSKGVDTEALKATIASRATLKSNLKQKRDEEDSMMDDQQVKHSEDVKPTSSVTNDTPATMQVSGEKTLKDAVKPKNKRRKRPSSNPNAS